MQSKCLACLMFFYFALACAPCVLANDAYLADQGAALVQPLGTGFFLAPIPGIFSNDCGLFPCPYEFKPGFRLANPFPRVIGVGQIVNISLFFKTDAGWDINPLTGVPIDDESSAQISLSGDWGTSPWSGTTPIPCTGFGGPSLRHLGVFPTTYSTPGMHILTVTVHKCWPVTVGCPIGVACQGPTGIAFSHSFAINVMPTTVSVLDPAPELVSGNVITTDPGLLATKGRPVSGVAADRVTQALIRIETPNDGDELMVSLLDDHSNPPAQSTSAAEDGALGKPGDTTFSASQVTVTASVVSLDGSGPAYAFVVYRAPEDFTRLLGSGSRSGNCIGQINFDDRLACRSVSIRVENLTTGGTPAEASVLIVRPPVAMIHGIWSEWKRWSDFSPLIGGTGKVDSRFSVLRVSYDDRVVSSISASVPQYTVSLNKARANSLGLKFNAPVEANH